MAGRSRPRRKRGARELSRGPGRVPGAGDPARGEARGPRLVRPEGRGREHAVRRALPSSGAPRVGFARAPGRTTYPGPQDGLTRGGPGLACGVLDGVAGELEKREENSYGLVQSPQSAPCGPPAAWKPHPASFQDGCAKHSSGVGNVVTKPIPERVGQTRGEAWNSKWMGKNLDNTKLIY
ncbi:uncharacterized protein V5649_014224 [Rhynchonycteris naso]